MLSLGIHRNKNSMFVFAWLIYCLQFDFFYEGKVNLNAKQQRNPLGGRLGSLAMTATTVWIWRASTSETLFFGCPLSIAITWVWLAEGAVAQLAASAYQKSQLPKAQCHGDLQRVQSDTTTSVLAALLLTLQKAFIAGVQLVGKGLGQAIFSECCVLLWASSKSQLKKKSTKETFLGKGMGTAKLFFKFLI